MRIDLLSILAFLLCSSAFSISAQPSFMADTKPKAPGRTPELIRSILHHNHLGAEAA